MHKSNWIRVLLLVVIVAGQINSNQNKTPASAGDERESAFSLYKAGKTAEAIVLLTKVVKENAQDFEAWLVLGLAQLQKEDLKDATKSIETALKLNSKLALAHAGLSYILLLRNKPSDAMLEAQTALDLNPNIENAHYVIAVARLRAGEKQEAVKHAEAAIKLNPQFAAAYLVKSQALVAFVSNAMVVNKEEAPETHKDHLIEAAAALEKFLQLNPTAQENRTWTEQLESLRFFAADNRQQEDRVFKGLEVTKKAHVRSRPQPAYPEIAWRNRISGTVVLRGIFAADGKVKHLWIVEAQPMGLTEAAIEAARRITFDPATINGRAVSMYIQLEYRFRF
ncbi:MAG TPA: TonB family protein [Pyrinomonadaceae bacterium]|nr:TonB family protein [Pyrinomonadaceae bacterium]